MLQTSEAPIYNDHELDFSKVREFLGLQLSLLAKLIGVSVSTLKNKKVSAETRTRATSVVKIVHHLWELSGHDENKSRRWLNEPKDRLLGLTPIEFMQINPKKNVPIIEQDLRKQRFGEAMGA
ncbi:MAG: hypothetical protein AB7I27_04870 [Bacteriovoracaceae bacterium]